MSPLGSSGVVGAAVWAALLAAVTGCEREPAPVEAGSLAAAAPEAGGAERATALGGFLAAHWELPVPAQGEPPAEFSEAEASLAPAVCGSCHPEQYAAWRTSLHAGAFSPGFAGQLVEGSLATPASLRDCQSCHAPLAEQQPFDASGGANPGFDAELRAQGIVCAACHRRAHRTFGPPRRAELPAPAADPPHAGFEARPEFQQSRFCAPCHQFFDEPGVAGKPLENTWQEWRESPQAAAGRTCQSCHMPDRAHLWRGIHDPETVRSAVDVELVVHEPGATPLHATLVLRNRDVGHRFPTYVTPRVFLALWQEDGEGRELSGTRREATIGREVAFSVSPPRERFDTRLAPGEAAELEYTLERAAAARALVGRVTVDPDHHYRGVFQGLATTLRDPAARAWIEQAQRRTLESSYVLYAARIPLDAAP